MKKTTKIILLIVAILVVAIVLGGTYLITKDKNETKNTINTENKQSEEKNYLETNEKVEYEEITKSFNGIPHPTEKGIHGDEAGLKITDISKNSNNTYTIKGVVYNYCKLTQEELNKLKGKKNITIDGEEYKVETAKDRTNLLANVEGDYYVKYYIMNDGCVFWDSQCPYSCRLTEKHMQITVEATTKYNCDEAILENTPWSVENLYNNIKNSEIDNSLPEFLDTEIGLFNFEFEDDKCVSIYEKGLL